MLMKGSKFAKMLMIVLTITVFLSTMVVNAFAKDAPKYLAQDNTLVEIQNPQSSMTMPGGITKIGSGVVTENADVVKEIIIGTNVKEIESGAFSNCENLKTVKIHQEKDDIKVASGAFPKSADILYLDDLKPTTTKAEKTTAAETTKEETTKETETTTTTKAEETTVEESTTEEEESEMKIINDTTPFADAKSQLSDMNIWDDLLEQTTQAAAPKNVNHPILNTASYAAVVVVAMSTIVLGYFKFKK